MDTNDKLDFIVNKINKMEIEIQVIKTWLKFYGVIMPLLIGGMMFLIGVIVKGG